MSRYKFGLAIENTRDPDYITEKLFGNDSQKTHNDKYESVMINYRQGTFELTTDRERFPMSNKYVPIRNV